MYIMTKIISLTNDVYSKLKKIKGSRSFSQEINELIDKSNTRGDVKSLRKFMGVWSKEEGERLQKQIANDRKNAKSRFFP